MAIEKDKDRGTWTVRIRYKDSKGASRVIKRRGFSRRRDAREAEIDILKRMGKAVNMDFDDFAEIYLEDIGPSIRENTIRTKRFVIDGKILPYFRKKKIAEIEPIDIVHWQNDLMKKKDSEGKGYSPVYLREIQSQFNAIMNHAERYYGLKDNPVRKIKNMGKKKAKEMSFWTESEYMRFRETQKKSPESFYAFEVLYWTGIREGELMALQRSDIDLEKRVMKISKSYVKIDGREIIGDPKTECSNRVVDLPARLCDELEDYFGMIYGIDDDTRLFTRSKGYYSRKLKNGTEEAGLDRIRIHDLRHSHISYLISIGFTAVEIGKRVGQESLSITLDYAHVFPSKQKEMVNRLDETMNMME